MVVAKHFASNCGTDKVRPECLCCTSGEEYDYVSVAGRCDVETRRPRPCECEYFVVSISSCFVGDVHRSRRDEEFLRGGLAVGVCMGRSQVVCELDVEV